MIQKHYFGDDTIVDSILEPDINAEEYFKIFAAVLVGQGFREVGPRCSSSSVFKLLSGSGRSRGQSRVGISKVDDKIFVIAAVNDREWNRLIEDAFRRSYTIYHNRGMNTEGIDKMFGEWKDKREKI
jgi:hypothetical protein